MLTFLVMTKGDFEFIAKKSVPSVKRRVLPLINSISSSIRYLFRVFLVVCRLLGPIDPDIAGIVAVMHRP